MKSTVPSLKVQYDIVPQLNCWGTLTRNDNDEWVWVDVIITIDNIEDK